MFASLTELRDALFEMNEEALSLDDLLLLKRMLPTDEEVKLVRE